MARPPPPPAAPCEPGYTWGFDSSVDANADANWKDDLIRFSQGQDGAFSGYRCMPPPVQGGSSALGIGTIGGIIGGTLGFIICILLPLALWFYRRNMLEKARISPVFAQELVNRASVDDNAGKLARRTLGTKGLEEVAKIVKRASEMSTDYEPEITSGHGLGAASLHEGVRAGHPLWHERGGRSDPARDRGARHR